MFDPTIFDNLKTVLEGACYDLDAAGEAEVTNREDLIDLSRLSRRFTMELRRSDGICTAQISLSSELPDFAAELRRLHAAGKEPGAQLLVKLLLPLSAVEKRAQGDAYLRELWGSRVQMVHEQTLRLNPEGGGELTVGADAYAGGAYSITLSLPGKLDEGHLEELPELAERVAASAAYWDELLQEKRV